jgi:hypothetical protein
MPVIADSNGKLYDIPDDVFAARMREVCKGYEMSDAAAAEYLRREDEVLAKMRSGVAKTDDQVKAYMKWDQPPGSTIYKPLPFDPSQPSPEGVRRPWVPRPRPWFEFGQTKPT